MHDTSNGGRATGVRPPFFTLVAVRAIAPVAGMPPKMEEKIFAVPCATNSILDLWLPPIIPSDTTADNRDSIDPNKAIVKAGRTRFLIIVKSKFGSDGVGNKDWILPNLLPIVSTGRFNNCIAAVVTSIAINEPGTLRVTFGQKEIIATVIAAIKKQKYLLSLYSEYNFSIYPKNQPVHAPFSIQENL